MAFKGDGPEVTNLNAGNLASGTVAVARGGTGASSLTANNVLIGNGTGAIQTVAPGTSGNVLTSNGTAWVSSTPAAGGGGKGRVFTSNGTFTIPAGVTGLKVTVVGGGGGGNTGGGNGGTSSVASGTQSITTISATGGAAGNDWGSQGGIGSNGDLNIRGQGGSGEAVIQSSSLSRQGIGGSSILGGGGTLGSPVGGSYGGGGAGSFSSGEFASQRGSGGGGGAAIKWLTGLTPGNTLSVTVGAGGTSGDSQRNGAAGVVIFEW